MAVIDVDETVLRAFMFYSCVVLLKMFLLVPLIGRMRFKKKVVSNPEDLKVPPYGAKITFDDPDVERVRRNHLNDLENIPAFIFISLLYMLTSPAPYIAIWHYRVFAAARILHTVAYQLPLPQPARGVAFAVGLFTCMSMLLQTLFHVA